MVSLKKIVACKCGQNNSFDFSSDMAVEDIAVTARCSSCSATIHVSVSAMLSPATPSYSPTITNPAQPAQAALNEQTEKEVQENVEQAVRDLFR